MELGLLQLALMVVLPAVGSYVGIRVGLAEVKGDIQTLRSILENHAAEIRILRNRTHKHSTMLGRLALQTKLGGFVMGDDSDG